MAELLHSELLNLLHYNQETGVFTYRIGGPNRRVGRVAGTLHMSALGPTGYWQISINRHLYLAHRLAWFYMTGEWPDAEIDHIDRDKSNNRWLNLRPATHAENNQNTIKSYSGQCSGFTRICYNELRGRWDVLVRFGPQKLFEQSFATKQEAAAAYAEAASLLFGAVLEKKDELTAADLAA